MSPHLVAVPTVPLRANAQGLGDGSGARGAKVVLSRRACLRRASTFTQSLGRAPIGLSKIQTRCTWLCNYELRPGSDVFDARPARATSPHVGGSFVICLRGRLSNRVKRARTRQQLARFVAQIARPASEARVQVLFCCRRGSGRSGSSLYAREAEAAQAQGGPVRAVACRPRRQTRQTSRFPVRPWALPKRHRAAGKRGVYCPFKLNAPPRPSPTSLQSFPRSAPSKAPLRQSSAQH